MVTVNLSPPFNHNFNGNIRYLNFLSNLLDLLSLSSSML